jgi:hypothetical protein
MLGLPASISQQCYSKVTQSEVLNSGLDSPKDTEGQYGDPS